MHANVHNTHSEPCQKLFNAINLDSYIRPHRHALDPKDECLVAIKGLFALIIFSDHGSVKSITLFGSEKYSELLSIASGLEISAGIWHTVVSLLDESILFEVKSGPFDSASSKEFAPWAPEEESNDSIEYLFSLRQKSLELLSTLNVSWTV
jgi:cupin fold WbuC family metalloprotein